MHGQQNIKTKWISYILRRSVGEEKFKGVGRTGNKTSAAAG